MQLDFHINTEKYKVNLITPDLQVVQRAAELIKSGGVIIYPTDTLYGIGVNAHNPVAMDRLYHIKGREKGKPVSLMIKNIEQAKYIVGNMTQEEERIFRALLPGKATVIISVKKPPKIPLMMQAEKIGFRIPECPLCLRLVTEARCPITSTSLNTSGSENVSDIHQIDLAFYDHIDLVLDAGPVRSTNGSTVIDATTSPATVLRVGDMPLSEVEKRLGHKVRTSYPRNFTITFICSGNICRSPMAQGIFKQIISRTKYRTYVTINSAGTFPLEPTPVDLNTLEIAQKQDIDLHAHISRPVTVDIIQEANLVVCLARDHYEYLIKKYPTQRDKIILLKQWYLHRKLVNPSVADPIGQPLEVHAEIFKEIQAELKRILPFVLKEIKLFLQQVNIEVRQSN
jgi:L-threonylcarbamoyladenylate synthase